MSGVCSALRLLRIVGLTITVVAGAAVPVFAQRPPGHVRRVAEAEAKGRLRPQLPPKAVLPSQDDFDVTYYDIFLDIDFNGQTIDGVVQMDARVTSTTLSTIDLDLFSNMTVTSIVMGGGSASFSHTNDVLSITLDHTYNQNEIFTLIVYYNGTPVGGSFEFDQFNGRPALWTLSEPYGARTWWPCKDVPSDKADSLRIGAEVPDTLTIATNGNYESGYSGGGRLGSIYKVGYPIATYLVSLAIHNYTIWTDWYHYGPTDSMPVWSYAYPEHVGNVQPAWDMTIPMMEAYGPLFGRYPFLDEKYGHAEFQWGGGMEHQTLTSVGNFNSEYLVAHELVHQWYGDMITCRTFEHIWLNEGFATYGEALWSEHQYGIAAYHADMAAAKYLGPGTIFVADTTDVDRIFHAGLSYNKASWVLHMLRHIVGDATFYDILHQYRMDFEFGTATTGDFQQVCETESGLDLDYFFQQWIYGEYYPEYSYQWTSAWDGGAQYVIDLDIEQIQSGQIFTMPIDVEIEFVTSTPPETTIVVLDSLDTQHFTLVINAEPASVVIDPDEWILRTMNPKLTSPTFDKGVLVVNGVDYNTYTTEIQDAYADSAFWSGFPITFWDVFPETNPAWYPSNLPPPVGHGAVPADSIGRYSVVVWIGNNFNGDLVEWYDTPIYSYLEAGGDVLLLARFGDDFLTGALKDYIGITWTELNQTLTDYIAVHDSLLDISLTGTQTFAASFDTTFTPPSSAVAPDKVSEFELLYRGTINGNTRGLGVWRHPTGGGTYRPDRANFAFLSGRPYRFDHDDLRETVATILELFGEFDPPVSVGPELRRFVNRLEQNHPNPFNPTTTIAYSIARSGPVTLRIYNVAGQLVRTLVDAPRQAGVRYEASWNGQNDTGNTVSTGVYFCRLHAGDFIATRKLVLLK